jgi:hypothetical protein
VSLALSAADATEVASRPLLSPPPSTGTICQNQERNGSLLLEVQEEEDKKSYSFSAGTQYDDTESHVYNEVERGEEKGTNNNCSDDNGDINSIYCCGDKSRMERGGIS